MADPTAQRVMLTINHAITDPAIWPYYGWHNDWREYDRTPDYKPAIQQDRYEFFPMLCAIMDAGLYGGRALQLGIGQSGLSHKMWRYVFEDVVSVDMDEGARFVGEIAVGTNEMIQDVTGNILFDEKFLYLPSSPIVSRAQLEMILKNINYEKINLIHSCISICDSCTGTTSTTSFKS